MCRKKNGDLATNKNDVNRQKEFFQETFSSETHEIDSYANQIKPNHRI